MDFIRTSARFVVTISLCLIGISHATPGAFGQCMRPYESLMRVPVGVLPSWLKAVDMNGDHTPDFVVIDSGLNSVQVILNQGDGTFGQPMSTPAGRRTAFLDVADLDGDLDLDVVTANIDQDAPSLLVLFNDGSGRLSAPQEYPLSNRLYGLDIGDVNHDQAPDVVGHYYPVERFVVFINDGRGALDPSMEFDGFRFPREVASADLDGDQYPELVAVDDPMIHILPNLGEDINGQWLGYGDPITRDVGGDLAQVEYVDLDGDDLPEQITLDEYDDRFRVFRNLGGLEFVLSQALTTAERPRRFVVRDVDLDLDQDLACVSWANRGCTVWYNDGDGTFSGRVDAPGDATSSSAMDVADVLGDELPDLITTNANIGAALIQENLGDRRFVQVESIDDLLSARRMVAADLNLDYQDDFVITEDDTTSFSYLLNRGNMNLDIFDVVRVVNNPYGLVVHDLIASEYPDVAIASTGDGMVDVFKNIGGEVLAEAGSYSVGSQPIALAAGDFNEDRLPDLACATYLGHDVAILLNLGDDRFQIDQRWPVGLQPIDLKAADVNGDGYLDLITANFVGDSISVLPGKEGPDFGVATEYFTGANPSALAIGMLNNDRWPDIVTANFADDSITVLINDGDGGFDDPTDIPVGIGPRDVLIRDVNDDQVMDVSVINELDSSVHVLLGLGDGTFDEPIKLAAGIEPRAMAVTDIDGDFLPDVIATSSVTDRFVFVPNSCASNVTPLRLEVDPLVAGRKSTFQLRGGTPGSRFVVVWSPQAGQFRTNKSGWCVDFGVHLPRGNLLSRIVIQGRFDPFGGISKEILIPKSVAGQTFLFQAAEHGTCPYPKMSNIVEYGVR